MIVTKETIQNWLEHHDIKNYIINDDLTVDVNDSVLLYDKKLKEIPFKFGIINGNFDCSCNLLQSLKNSPKVINGGFDCSHNQLNSLKYCPEEIKGYFDCSSNLLASLKFSPQKLKGSFYCSRNQLIKKSLINFNSVIKGIIKSDFGNKEEFLNKVKLQKLLKEKEELNKNIISDFCKSKQKRL